MIDGFLVLHASSDIDCTSDSYKQFRIYAIVMTALYGGLPLKIFDGLRQQHSTLNPSSKREWRVLGIPVIQSRALAKREVLHCNCLYRFMWEHYRPSFYAW